MKTVDNISFAGKKALVRVDFNVPLNQELRVSDNKRIRAALPTLNKILIDGGSLVLMSHMGRPKGEKSLKLSLQNIITELSELLGRGIQFLPECIGPKVETAVQNLKVGQVILLENLRFYPEEKKGDEAFAKQLADLGCDIYVNDAFGTAHRAHASTFTVAKYFKKNNRVAGYLMGQELKNAAKVIKSPARPFTAILGGAKVSDKIELIDQLLSKVSNLIIGGGMAYTFLAAQGGKIGDSLFEPEKLGLAKELLEKANKQGVEIILPEDTVVANAFSNTAKTQICSSLDIPEGWMGLDIGPITEKIFASTILQSKTILWNGPMGVFEMSKFQSGTKSMAEAVAKATKENKAYSLIGGGDSASAVTKFGFSDQVSFVSTGGGAMLELLEGKTLPGIAALS